MKGIGFTEMDIEKLIVIQAVIDGKRTGKEASDKLNLSERQIWRLVKKVRENGPEGIKHKNCFIKQPRLETLRQMLKDYGIPKCLYPDKFSIFFPVKAQKLTIEEQLQGKTKPTTQFKRIIDVLGIDMFPAATSQAKGRIERLWNTFQDRLVTEFKLAEIKTIDEANEFLKSYLKKYNKKFAVKAESDESNFVLVPNYLDLKLLLAIKITRTIDNSGSFTIKNKKFQILNNNIMPKSKINVYISKKIGIIAEYNNTKYKVICSDNLPSKYSTLSMNEFYKEHYQELLSFALSLLTYNAKEKEPLLVTS